MSATWKSRLHAAAAVAVLIAACLLIGVPLVTPALALRAANAEHIGSLHAQAAKLERLGASVQALQVQVSRLEQAARRQTGFLEADYPSLAVAELQERIKTAARKRGAEIVSQQSIAAGGDDAHQSVLVAVHLRGGVAALQALLHDLEYGTPLLVLDDVVIQRMTRATAPAASDELDVRFRATGYLAAPDVTVAALQGAQ